jgi:hypothetical protein
MDFEPINNSPIEFQQENYIYDELDLNKLKKISDLDKEDKDYLPEQMIYQEILAAKYCYEGDYENAKKYANKSLDAG